MQFTYTKLTMEFCVRCPFGKTGVESRGIVASMLNYAYNTFYDSTYGIQAIRQCVCRMGYTIRYTCIAGAFCSFQFGLLKYAQNAADAQHRPAWIFNETIFVLWLLFPIAFHIVVRRVSDSIQLTHTLDIFSDCR